MKQANPREPNGSEPLDAHDALRTGQSSDANVERPSGAALYHYMEGARAVIDLIVERFRQGGKDFHDADTLVFPLGLQCRHLVELRLKELYQVLTHEEAQYHHKLLNLWLTVRPLIEERWPTSNRSSGDRYGHLPREILAELGIVLRTEGDLDRAEALIAALDEIDPLGVSFRYPGTIPAQVKSVSLEKLADTALELDAFLEGCVVAVYEENATRAEIEAEFRAEVESEYRDLPDW